MRVLAIDIGGTKSSVGLCTIKGLNVLSIEHQENFESRKFARLETMIHEWKQRHPSSTFDAIGAGAAGPVIDQRVHLTNLGWSVDSREVAREFNVSCLLCNDMVSHGWGILGLQNKDRVVINQGTSKGKGPIALIAAGTGLGEAVIGWDGYHHIPMGGEGGHSSFSPADEREDQLLLELRHRWNGHVSWERILGGYDGFRELSKFLIRFEKRNPPEWMIQLSENQGDWGPQLIQAANHQEEVACRILDFYSLLYGREASNLALKCVPESGVYLGGGIAQRILPWLHKNFMKGFTDKGRFKDLLDRIPVYVITDPLNGLKGAALQFSETKKHNP